MKDAILHQAGKAGLTRAEFKNRERSLVCRRCRAVLTSTSWKGMTQVIRRHSLKHRREGVTGTMGYLPTALQCHGFLRRGTRDGVPMLQCCRKYRWDVVAWPGEPREMMSKMCTQHKDQSVREHLEARVPYRLVRVR